mgnify:CR=1 FL=1
MENAGERRREKIRRVKKIERRRRWRRRMDGRMVGEMDKGRGGGRTGLTV